MNSRHKVKLCFSDMLTNKSGKMTGVFTKVGRFYKTCLEFGEKPVNFTPGKFNYFFNLYTYLVLIKVAGE